MTNQYISFNELLSFGVKESYLKVALFRNRNGSTNSWRNTRLEDDQRKVLIELDSIPESTRLKYGIPTGEEYQRQIDEEKNAKQIEKLKIESDKKEFEALQTANNSIKRLVYAYESDFQQYIPAYTKRFSYNNKLSPELPIQYAREHAFWIEMIYMTGNEYSHEFGAISKYFPLFMECKKHIKLEDLITSEAQFRRKLNQIREALGTTGNIVNAIVPAFYKESASKKSNDFHVALAVSILSHPKAYPYRVAADIINHHCILEGQKPITESWIKNLLCDNKLKTLIFSTRKGGKHFNDNILPHTVRNVTEYPGNIWMIDGTPVQFYCWNKNRTKVIRLNLFVVIDVCTRKILGIDISYSEDKWNVINALKMAVKTTGHLPKEIVSDNFSGKRSEEIMDIKEQLEKLGSIWRHARVQNPSDKAYVERFFGAFQSVECALQHDYIGEGITSRNPNARIAPEYLAKVAKEKGYPSENEMRQRIGMMVAKYNERSTAAKPSPNDAYTDFPKPNIIEMDALRTALFFWSKTTYTVRRGMVKITVRKVEHVYEIYEHDLKMEYQDTKVTVRYDENDLDTVMLFDDSDRPICECRKSIRINMGLADRTQDDIENTYRSDAKKKSYAKHIEKTRDEIIDKGLKVIGKETMDIADPLALEKNQVNSQESREFMRIFHDMNGITEDEIVDFKPKKPLAVIAQKGVTIDVREKLLEKKPSEKGSLRVIPTPDM